MIIYRYQKDYNDSSWSQASSVSVYDRTKILDEYGYGVIDTKEIKSSAKWIWTDNYSAMGKGVKDRYVYCRWRKSTFRAWYVAVPIVILVVLAVVGGICFYLYKKGRICNKMNINRNERPEEVSNNAGRPRSENRTRILKDLYRVDSTGSANAAHDSSEALPEPLQRNVQHRPHNRLPPLEARSAATSTMSMGIQTRLDDEDRNVPPPSYEECVHIKPHVEATYFV